MSEWKPVYIDEEHLVRICQDLNQANTKNMEEKFEIQKENAELKVLLRESERLNYSEMGYDEYYDRRRVVMGTTKEKEPDSGEEEG